MTPDEFRRMLQDEKIGPSFLAYTTKIPFEKIQRFLDGDRLALSDAEYEKLVRNCEPDELERFRNTIIHGATLDAVGGHLEQFSVAFFHASKRGELNLGSGTLVRVDNHFFVATAGHLVHQTRMLQFVGKNISHFECDHDESGRPINIRGGCNIGVKKGGKSDSFDIGEVLSNVVF